MNVSLLLCWNVVVKLFELATLSYILSVYFVFMEPYSLVTYFWSCAKCNFSKLFCV